MEKQKKKKKKMARHIFKDVKELWRLLSSEIFSDATKRNAKSLMVKEVWVYVTKKKGRFY